MRTQDPLLELGTLVTGVAVVSGDELPIALMSLGIAADVTVVGHLSGEPGTIKASHTRCEGKRWRRLLAVRPSVGHSTVVIGFSLVKELF